MVFDEILSYRSSASTLLSLGPDDHKETLSSPFNSFSISKSLSPSGGLSFADVRDVADAVVTALSKAMTEANICLVLQPKFHALSKVLSYSGVCSFGPLPKQTHKVLGWFPKWKNIGETVGIDLQGKISSLRVTTGMSILLVQKQN